MARGYHAAGDLLTALADGTDLNRLWQDYSDAVAEYNARRGTLVNLLSFKTTLAVDAVLQSFTGNDFEDASEQAQAWASYDDEDAPRRIDPDAGTVRGEVVSIHASWLVEQIGRPGALTIVEIAERLGHASTKMTLDRYSHSQPDRDKRNATAGMWAPPNVTRLRGSA